MRRPKQRRHPPNHCSPKERGHPIYLRTKTKRPATILKTLQDRQRRNKHPNNRSLSSPTRPQKNNLRPVQTRHITVKRNEVHPKQQQVTARTEVTPYQWYPTPRNKCPQTKQQIHPPTLRYAREKSCPWNSLTLRHGCKRPHRRPNTNAKKYKRYPRRHRQRTNGRRAPQLLYKWRRQRSFPTTPTRKKRRRQNKTAL